MPHLTVAQQTVLTELAAGASITVAARTADVHRNTVHNWLRGDTSFFFHLQGAFQAQSAEARAQMNEHIPAAQETIRLILAGELGTPALRLRTALAVMKAATAPFTEFVETRCLYRKPDLAEAARIQQANDYVAKWVPDAAAQSLHNARSEQARRPSTIRRTGPKLGRNERCPCQSGRKYKQCCLGKSTTTAQDALAA